MLIYRILKSLILICGLVIISKVYTKQAELISTVDALRKSQVEVLKNANQQNLNEVNAYNRYEEFIETEISRGVIKKEKIPADLELGDYWYWFYFDDPYLLKENSTGYPRYVNKIQVIMTKNVNQQIDNFLNTHVEIFSKKTWGYAESNVLEIIAITQI